MLGSSIGYCSWSTSNTSEQFIHLAFSSSRGTRKQVLSIIIGREHGMRECLIGKQYVSRIHAKLTVENGTAYIENNEENEDTRSAGNGADKSVIDKDIHCLGEFEVRAEDCAGKNTDKQRAVNLFCNKRQNNGNLPYQNFQNPPDCEIESACLWFRFRYPLEQGRHAGYQSDRS